MKNNIIFLFMGILIGLTLYSLFTTHKTENWKPVMEKIGFQYLDYSVEGLIKEIKKAELDLSKNKSTQLDKELHSTMILLFKLEYYYLPITEARQLIFDADRLVSMGKIKQAEKNLLKAITRLKKIERLKGNSIIKNAVNDLENKIKQAILVLNEPYEKSSIKIESAGVASNLMLLKGKLILSTITLNKDNTI